MKLLLSDIEKKIEGIICETIQLGPAPETTLPYADSTVESLEVDGVAEFYGSIAGLYALSEWFRVLQPGGKLRMHCVNIEALFERYLLAKNEEDKQSIINKMYISQRSNQHYVCCFPRPLLEKLLRQSGFTFIEFHREADSLKVSCKKPKKKKFYQTIAGFRKKAVKDGWVDPYDHLAVLSMEEEFFSPLGQRWNKYLEEKNEALLIQIIVLGAMYHPALTRAFFLLSEVSRALSPVFLKRAMQTLDLLTRCCFPALLIFSLTQFRKDSEKWNATYQRVRHVAGDCIEQILSQGGKKGEITIKKFFPLVKDPQFIPEKNAKFSKKYILEIANDDCYLGIKELGMGRLEAAENFFKKALHYCWELPLAEWNLAIASALQGKWQEAIGGYLRLMRSAPPEIIPVLEQELAVCYFLSDNKHKAIPLFKKRGIIIGAGYSPVLRKNPVLAEESYNWTGSGREAGVPCC